MLLKAHWKTWKNAASLKKLLGLKFKNFTIIVTARVVVIAYQKLIVNNSWSRNKSLNKTHMKYCNSKSSHLNE